MSVSSRLPRFFSQDFLSVVLLLFLVVLWLAGGASREDAAGQVVVRVAAAATLCVAVLVLPARRVRLWPVVVLLMLSIALPLLQLVPLPPGWWQGLPGRAPFVDATAISREALPWRPLSLSPSATRNALASLLVPAAMLALLAGTDLARRAWLPVAIVGLVVASTLLGLLQAGGAGLDNPLINDSVNEVSGSFANRNHFALFLAMGCLICPVWAFSSTRRAGWRAVPALGLMLVFALMILASGSRAGLLLGAIAIVLGIVQAREGIRHELRRRPRWVFPALMAGAATVAATLVLVAVAADRAAGIDRILSVDPGQDMRSRGLPTVLLMIRTYFPAGTGLGSFDPMFRLHEPFDLLKPSYFNHAHSDWLEIILDAGVPGLFMLLAATGWWAWATVAAWRAASGSGRDRARLGSSLLLLVMVASAFDYPARTPIIMAMMVVAAVWLADRDDVAASRLALPGDKQLL